MDSKRINQKIIQLKAHELLRIWGGMMQAGSIYLGDKLGLYAGLDATGPVTYVEFAKHMGMDNRYIQEWLEGQVAAGLLEYDFTSSKFSISPEITSLLTNEEASSFMAGIFSQIHPLYQGLKMLPKCFKTGEGFDFDVLGIDVEGYLSRSEPIPKPTLCASS